MKKLFPVICLFLGSCAGWDPRVETYNVGEYSVFIASQEKVNSEYQKVCILHCSKSVKGFVNFRSREMWAIHSLPVVMHEFRHIVEGQYHERPVTLK
ncbi:MAG: hypothetical protein ACE5E9_11165 [Nitrospinaceae bacterium]